MPEAWGPLSGPGNQEVYLYVARVDQDPPTNTSVYYAEVRYYGNGYGSYGVNGSWSINCGGFVVSGGFSIPYEQRNDTYTVLWAGYWSKGHDSNGYLSSFGCSASISTDHGSVGNGSVSFTESAAPRIPKKPSTPGTPTFSQITPTSVRVSWSSSSDNGGSNIDYYRLRYRTSSPSNGSGSITSDQNNTSRVISGLTPGQSYWFGVYAHNDSDDNDGYSSKSADASLGTPAGVYVSDGTNWIPTGLYVSDGSSWVPLIPAVSTGSAWVNPV